ncbi:hypothetical protein DER45DRAFT_576165 [Fusarium avenaceum]|nr:hypothetical protein DER45DRAFT_576165 [Fusarium avenaceum]
MAILLCNTARPSVLVTALFVCAHACRVRVRRSAKTIISANGFRESFQAISDIRQDVLAVALEPRVQLVKGIQGDFIFFGYRSAGF